MATVQHVQGLAELQAKLVGLAPKVRQSALKPAVAAGARVVKRAAIIAAPIGKGPKRRGGAVVAPGTLKRAAIIKYVRVDSSDTQVVYIVTFRRGKAQQKKSRDAFYAPFVEFGHKNVPRRTKGGGTNRSRRAKATQSGSRTPAHRFFGPAFNASAGLALTEIQNRLGAELRKLPEFSA